jgi:hypothetical protein
MARALQESTRPIGSCKLGFFVLAPESRIKKGIFFAQMTKQGIRRKLEGRVLLFSGLATVPRQRQWLHEWALPLLDAMTVECYSWEAAIAKVVAADPGYGASLGQFYQNCKEFNKRVVLLRPTA